MATGPQTRFVKYVNIDQEEDAGLLKYDDAYHPSMRGGSGDTGRDGEQKNPAPNMARWEHDGGPMRDDSFTTTFETPAETYHPHTLSQRFSLWLARQTSGHSVPLAWAGAGLITSIAFFLMLRFKNWLPDAYFKFTDPNTTFFDNFQINTEERFAIGAAIVFVNTFVNTFIGSVVGNWINNGVNDFKTSLAEATGGADPNLSSSFSMSPEMKAKVTVQIYVIYGTLSRAVSIYFMFVNFWFIMVQMLASMAAVWLTTSAFLKAKSLNKKNDDHAQRHSGASYAQTIESMEHGMGGSRSIQIRI